MKYFKSIKRALRDIYGDYVGNGMTIVAIFVTGFTALNILSAIFYFIREITFGNYIPLFLVLGLILSVIVFYLNTKYNEAKEEVEEEEKESNNENKD